MWATEVTGYYTTVQKYAGDAYGTNGYIGAAGGSVTKDKTLFYLFTWRLNGQ
jgi:hypothetical protein